MDSKTPKHGSLAHLIELAIHGERAFETFYKQVAAKFNHHPDIEKFWIDYAAEENQHAHWLEALRDRIAEDVLDSPADPLVLEDAERALITPFANLLLSIRTLQDAFEVANELEHSETNAIIDFLITHFSEDDQVRDFLRAQLNQHIARLMIEFPRDYGTGSLRRGIQSNEF